MAAIVTFAGVAHPWLCDAMGHMNVRHYAAMFDDANFQLLGHIAGSDQGPLGWADIRIETEFLQETSAGTLLTIHSHVAKIGRSSLASVHLMTGTLDHVLRARVTATTVRFDTGLRKSTPLDDAARQRAEALFP